MSDLSEFLTSIEVNEEPSKRYPIPLQALWYAKKGDWQRSHHLVQNDESKNAAWVHAYLHRFEGDEGNARYWYSQANKNFPHMNLEQEWREIVNVMLHPVE